MYNRKELKRGAKQLIRASAPHYMLVMLVYILLTTGLSTAVTALTGTGEILNGVISIFLNILIALFSMVMGVGLANYALLLSRRQQRGMGDLFESFSYAGRSIGVELLAALYSFLWSLLLVAGCAVAGGVGYYLTEWTLAGGIAVIAVAYIALMVGVIRIALRYAMAPFALAEDPESGAAEAVRRSVRMMRGHKGKLFMLELSFIGWELLTALIAVAVMVIGLLISGVSWLAESLLVNGGDWLEIYSAMNTLADHMNIWIIVAEVAALPLTLWLTAYSHTACARFYNYVSGYDYHVYMNGEDDAAPAQDAPAAPLPVPDAPAPETPVQDVPAQETPMRDAPAPDAPQEPADTAPEEAPAAPSADGYYTSIFPPEKPEEE